MPLAPVPVERKRLHTRRISYDGWHRADGLFDIEARIVDAKDIDYPLASGVRPAGVPVHDMWARLTIDEQCVVRAIETSMDGVPYPGGCDDIPPDYAKLVGANLLHGFRKALHDLVGGARGCTHLTELISFLPTAAMQTFASLRRDTDARGGKPFQLGHCHALVTSTETVRRYYPKWYRGTADTRAPQGPSESNRSTTTGREPRVSTRDPAAEEHP
jgi:hypothetical protein